MGSASESKTTSDMLLEKQKKLEQGTDQTEIHIREVLGNSLESCSVSVYFLCLVSGVSMCVYLSQTESRLLIVILLVPLVF